MGCSLLFILEKFVSLKISDDNVEELVDKYSEEFIGEKQQDFFLEMQQTKNEEEENERMFFKD